MSDNKKKMLIILLSLIIVGLITYGVIDHKKQTKKIDNLEIEKEKIYNQLDSLSILFDNAITEKTQLSDELFKQKNNILRFKDSLKSIKNTNWKLIKFYKNKIKNLAATTDKMIVINDSLAKRNNLLNFENQDLFEQKEKLTTEKQKLSTNLKKQTEFNDNLVNQNLDLAKKVELGAIIRANNFNITTYDEKRNGHFKQTNKARRVNTFKTSFLLNENPLANNKDIIVFVVVKDPQGKVISKKGKFIANDNLSVYFSERTIIPYKKLAVATEIIISTNEKIIKGNYTITTYLDNKLVNLIETTLD